MAHSHITAVRYAVMMHPTYVHIEHGLVVLPTPQHLCSRCRRDEGTLKLRQAVNYTPMRVERGCARCQPHALCIGNVLLLLHSRRVDSHALSRCGCCALHSCHRMHHDSVPDCGRGCCRTIVRDTLPIAVPTTPTPVQCLAAALHVEASSHDRCRDTLQTRRVTNVLC